MEVVIYTFYLPLNMAKYAFWYLMPSSSFQKCVGIEGNGLVHTNSPLSSYTGSPIKGHKI